MRHSTVARVRTLPVLEEISEPTPFHPLETHQGQLLAGIYKLFSAQSIVALFLTLLTLVVLVNAHIATEPGQFWPNVQYNVLV